jgi:hypothetical protein
LVRGLCYAARQRHPHDPGKLFMTHHFNDYAIKDIGLADWGRKELTSPRRKCPA